MVNHIVLFKLKTEVADETVEQMMRNTRIRLLKIPEVLGVKCGKRINPKADWPFFVAVELESMDKLTVFLDDSNYLKYVQEVIKPYTSDRLTLDFEMEPGKDIRFS